MSCSNDGSGISIGAGFYGSSSTFSNNFNQDLVKQGIKKLYNNSNNLFSSTFNSPFFSDRQGFNGVPSVTGGNAIIIDVIQ